MDLAPFLLLTVVGGYRFASEFILSRYEIARAQGHRLYFEAIRYGLLLAIGFSALVFAIAVAVAVVEAEASSHFELFIYMQYVSVLGAEASPRAEIVAQACILSALFGHSIAQLVSSWFLNFHGMRPYVEKAIRNNDLERLIFESWRDGEFIALTLDTGKFYVGTPVEMPDPKEQRRFLRILPMFSGHRHPETSKVNLTTSYYELLYDLSEDAPKQEFSHLKPEDFELVIDADRIVSSNRFDYDVWREFQRQPPKSPLQFD